MIRKHYLIIIVGLFLTACSSTHTLEKRVTKENYRAVSIENQQEKQAEPFRIWPDESVDFLLSKEDGSTPLKVKGDRLNILALSGGGANGAYGAGIINGLHDSGQLNEYTVVTGISAGALMAPFVFIGGDEISHLKAVTLGMDDSMVLGSGNIINALIKDAFSDGDDMFGFIEKIYTEQIIEKMAAQHRAGRRLFIGTSHFDSDELVVWNIGAIAQSDFPDKMHLIHQVLTASASIPGVFPPQFIDVNYQGETFEELHVDGGMSAQVFFKPGHLDYSKINVALGLTTTPRVDVIRNGVFTTRYYSTQDKGVELLKRSVDSMVVQQSLGDLYRMLYFSEVEHIDLFFTQIEEDFQGEKATQDMFDLHYMNALYEYGYAKAIRGNLWKEGAQSIYPR